MIVEMIKVSEAYQSPTNPRAIRKDQSFKDLVASIKEKGMLVPVIARPGSAFPGQKYEIVAGNRRLAAAMELGLNNIPAEIRKMDDAEAREVQIIENLQRADVHPLDEGESYRQLREESKQEIKSIAAKVGKSEDYVRGRMFLTNLQPKARDAYRAGDIGDGHAFLIARLGPTDQIEALKYCLQYNNLPTMADLKSEIDTRFNKPLSHQPWLGNLTMEKVVGACKECPPNKADLFGKVKDGTCTDLKCWSRKMAAYIDYRVAKENLLRISHDYRYAGDRKKGMLYSSDYTALPIRTKQHCKHACQAIVVEGPKVATVQWVCADQSCKHHGKGGDPYTQTPAEKKRRQQERKKELAREKSKLARHQKETEKILKKAIKKTGVEMSGILFDLGMVHTSTNDYRAIAQRRKLDVPRTKTQYQPKGYLDYEKAIRNARQKMDSKQVFQLAIELLLPSYDSYRRGAIAKLF